jgi:5-methylcytosine-specific restriction endonuclease McrA
MSKKNRGGQKELVELHNIQIVFAPGGRFREHRRLQCFAVKGCACVKCGIVGVELRTEKWKDGSLHTDLYAFNSNGHQVLMTVDHIIPKSKGGPNHIDNYQPMCEPCNAKKGNTLPDESNQTSKACG